MLRRSFFGVLCLTVALDMMQRPLVAAETSARRTILLVDDREVLYRSGTTRVLSQPVRCGQNPVIRPTRPWEMAIAWTSIHRQPESGVYQLWYQAYAGNRAQDKTRRCVVCYAESKDGIHFSKPDLGLFDFNGIESTNIVLVANGGMSDRYSNAVVFDPRDPDPKRRYKMAYNDFTEVLGHQRPGLCVAFSPDGIHWEKDPRSPVQLTAYGRHGTPVPFTDQQDLPRALPLTMSDAVDVFYDTPRDAFVIYGKMWIDGPAGGMFFKHAMGRIESKDFLDWSRPQLVCAPDDLDAAHVEFHTTPVFFHHGYYFCLNQILDRGTGGGVIDIELMISQDGLRWERPFRRPFFLPRSDGNRFDSGSIFTNATPVILDDEIRFYYGAYSQGATGADDRTHESGVGFASIRRDRFAGIRTEAVTRGGTLRKLAKQIGQVTFKPMSLGGLASLTINADASGGQIRAELLGADGKRIRGWTAEDAVPIEGDSLSHAVRFEEAQLADLPEGEYLLRLHLESATLYAVTLIKQD